MQNEREARERLEQAFLDFRKEFERVNRAVAAVQAAGPEDDVYRLLGELEEAVAEVRTGGLIGSGAKKLRKAREEWLAFRGDRTER